LGGCGDIRTVHARRLAAAAGADLLVTRFTSGEGEPRFLSADVWPDVASANVAGAILEYFCERC
jgi:hypothetical protein